MVPSAGNRYQSVASAWNLRELPNAINPYTPPEIEFEALPWWYRLSPLTVFTVLRFRFGHPIRYYGVVFFLERKDRTTLHAALPSAEANEERMDHLRDEAARVLIPFLQTHRPLHFLLRGRSLSVRMIESYADFRHLKMKPLIVPDAVDLALRTDSKMTAQP